MRRRSGVDRPTAMTTPPAARLGRWQPYPSRRSGHGMLVRFISCVDCGLELARQIEVAFLLPDEPAAQLVASEESEHEASLRDDAADADDAAEHAAWLAERLELFRQTAAAHPRPDEPWLEASQGDDAADADDAIEQLAPDSAVATELRAELSYLGLTADGHALYGRAAHVQRGHAPRRGRRVAVILGEQRGGYTRFRPAYLPEKMAADEILPGDPPGIWFKTRLGEQPSLIGEKPRPGAAAEKQHAGCEAYCLNCGRRQFISTRLLG